MQKIFNKIQLFLFCSVISLKIVLSVLNQQSHCKYFVFPLLGGRKAEPINVLRS